MKASSLAVMCKQSYASKTFSVGSLEVLLIHHPFKTFVVVRGTDSVADAIVDARTFPWYDWDCGWCHVGFLKGGKSLVAELLKRVNKETPLVFTGHSLGGALSLVIAMKLLAKGYNVNSWVGIASPRLFKFTGRIFGFPVVNYRNRGDIVPRIPINYSHDYEVVQLGKDRFPSFTYHGIEAYIKELRRRGR